ncbi:MAG: DUF1285 domain-containing protein [Deltaproteobacteria bacterium]|nr:MAG: DUF1285 domain-containing protein [Deltaproteobacteria bacterium]
MARAGFTAISSGKIKFGKDGRWYSDDELIPNRAIGRLFSRALQVLPDGRARLELGEDRADVIIEDTPWVVTAVEGSPQQGFTIVLNDETRELLDPATLRIGAENVLYCRVKGGAHEARWLRPAYYDLMRYAETGPGAEVVLPVGGRRIRLAAA